MASQNQTTSVEALYRVREKRNLLAESLQRRRHDLQREIEGVAAQLKRIGVESSALSLSGGPDENP